MEAIVIKTRPNSKAKDCVVVTVRCPYCKDTHTHGSNAHSTYPEHRGADCFKGSYTFRLRDKEGK